MDDFTHDRADLLSGLVLQHREDLQHDLPLEIVQMFHAPYLRIAHSEHKVVRSRPSAFLR